MSSLCRSRIMASQRPVDTGWSFLRARLTQQILALVQPVGHEHLSNVQVTFLRADADFGRISRLKFSGARMRGRPKSPFQASSNRRSIEENLRSRPRTSSGRRSAPASQWPSGKVRLNRVSSRGAPHGRDAALARHPDRGRAIRNGGDAAAQLEHPRVATAIRPTWKCGSTGNQ